MKAGYDIIYQGVLHDYNNHLYGSPDLLIRSDKFNQIFNMTYLNIVFCIPLQINYEFKKYNLKLLYV